ncbi:MAG: anhydro-N-acetylmuramic acid kinase [Gammaproteobacteria bacterium]|nr:anhydro-N-acetylmuramic acid kinase [Gammaproteobacteria bacterium]
MVESEYYIGLMSGTSMDGVDGVLAKFEPTTEVLGQAYLPFPAALKITLLQLNQVIIPNELHISEIAGLEIAHIYADVVDLLLNQTHIDRSCVRAIGMHGVTIRHKPIIPHHSGYTLQIGKAAELLGLCNLDVVYDFRSLDIANQGQGAPLTPAFHHYFWGKSYSNTGLLNLGGIANITYLRDPLPTIGFDTGPANVFLDFWAQTHLHQAHDEKGNWARLGTVHAELLRVMLNEPYFQLLPPKSTGRDLFNVAWLQEKLAIFPAIPPVEVQATLLALTVQTISQAIMRHTPSMKELFVCGGGAYNHALLEQLQLALPKIKIATTEALGIPCHQVEALAFAWLARQRIHQIPVDLKFITGASKVQILGAHLTIPRF